MIKVNYLPHLKAYAVRLHGQLLGVVRFRLDLPFRRPVEFV